jgi:virginiamycin B lyase
MLSPAFQLELGKSEVFMFMKRTLLTAIAATAVLWGLTTLSGTSTPTPPAQAPGSVLTGLVTGPSGTPMEGVLVSARRDGSNMTVTVVSNASGFYAFPKDRLEPGRYTVSIRAAGYVMPGREKTVEVTRQTAEANLRLEEASLLEKALQLTSAEWLYSYPLPEQTKYATLRDCTRCHSQAWPAMSTYDAATAAYVVQRMIYSSGSTPASYQVPANEVPNWGRPDGVMGREPSRFHQQQGEAVASINLGKGPWQYPLKTFPRPKGKETQVILTMYDLKRPLAKPHDLQIGPDGLVYYNDFNDNIIGKLNPKTGETKEYRYPYMGEKGSFTPIGNRTMMHDGNGKFYLGTQYQLGPAIFDSKSETFELYKFSGAMTLAESSHVDGWVWNGGAGASLSRVQLKGNGQIMREMVRTEEGSLAAYDIVVDSKNNVYGGDRTSTAIWKIDAKTLKPTFYPIPAQPRGQEGSLGGGMRRATIDSRDRMWWGGFDGGFLGLLDTTRPAGQEIKLFPVPLPWFQPYIGENDDAGYTWIGSISADRVARMNEATGEWNMYLLPRETNLRHIHVQRAANAGGLSSLWVGMNHQARIVHIEPLAR